MKIRNSVRIGSLALLAAFFICGCAAGAEPSDVVGGEMVEAEAETDTEVGAEASTPDVGAVEGENADSAPEWSQTVIKLPYASMRLTYDITVRHDITYYFEAEAMESSEAEAYIEKVEAFFESVAALTGQNDTEQKLTVYVGDDLTNACCVGEMYINTEDMDSLHTFFQLLIAVCPETSDFGQAYGVAALGYERSGGGTIERKYDDAELAAYFSEEEHLYLLDFTLPMFEQQWFDADTVAYVQAAAISLTEFMEDDRDGFDLGETDEQKLEDRKNKWLDAIGVIEEYKTYKPLQFAYNHKVQEETYPYVLQGEMANWYFAPEDMRASNYRTMLEEYAEILPLMESDFADAQALLADYFTEEIPAVDICTIFYRSDEERYELSGAIYAVYDEVIYLLVDWTEVKCALLHEYVHYLTLGGSRVFPKEAYNKGLLEGLTEELAVIECENRMGNLGWQEIIQKEGSGGYDEIGVWNEETTEFNEAGYHYFWAKKFYSGDSEEEYLTINKNATERPEEITFYNLSYYEATSMSQYLLQQYGREKVYRYCVTFDGFEELCGRSFKEVYADWIVWNDRKCEEIKAGVCD